MGELDRLTVVAAAEAWARRDDGEVVVETDEYRLARLPEPNPDPLQLRWIRTSRPAARTLDDVIAAATGFRLPGMTVYATLTASDDVDRALLERGAELTDTSDVLARALPADIDAPALPGLEVRWRTTFEAAREGNQVGAELYGVPRATEEQLAQRAAAGRATYEAGTGGSVVGYIHDEPVAIAGLEIADGVARLWGGGVLEEYRGRGVYRALVAERLAYAIENGATMALTQGRVSTSSPILRRLGFTAWGRERCYRLPLG